MTNKEEAMQLITIHKGALDILEANKYTQGYTEGFRKGILCSLGIWMACFVIGYVIGLAIFM